MTWFVSSGGCSSEPRWHAESPRFRGYPLCGTKPGWLCGAPKRNPLGFVLRTKATRFIADSGIRGVAPRSRLRWAIGPVSNMPVAGSDGCEAGIRLRKIAGTHTIQLRPDSPLRQKVGGPCLPAGGPLFAGQKCGVAPLFPALCSLKNHPAADRAWFLCARENPARLSSD